MQARLIDKWKCYSSQISVLALTHCVKPGTSKTGFGQVKIMKEFVWINIIFSSKFGFKASRWTKMKVKTEYKKCRTLVAWTQRDRPNYF